MGVYRRILYPCVDVVWQEESPTFHNFADPILHNIVIKDIFAWVYLVSTEQITNGVSLEIIGIGYNSSEMDRDRYSCNCLFKDNGEEEEEQKKILYEIPWETMNFPLCSHWHVCSEKP